MLRSMTGYGKGIFEDEKCLLIIEIKGVNNRYLDINVRIPRSLFFLEEKIRRKISQTVKRGRIDVFVNLNNLKREDLVVNLNESLLNSYMDCLNLIKDKYDIEEHISINSIARLPEVITIIESGEDLNGISSIIDKCLDISLDNFIRMRNEEGALLETDIISKCLHIKHSIAIIEEMSPKVIENNKKKLEERITEGLLNFELDKNRLYQEFCFMADKLSIDEEIVRIKCHLESFLKHIHLNEASGKKMDFIVQEMNREANTIGSKCNNMDITNAVVEIKNELEKIREQIQNIE